MHVPFCAETHRRGVDVCMYTHVHTYTEIHTTTYMHKYTHTCVHTYDVQHERLIERNKQLGEKISMMRDKQSR